MSDYLQTLNNHKERLEEDNKALQSRVDVLEKLIEGESYEVFKFNEGAAWMSGSILSLHGQQLKEMTSTMPEKQNLGDLIGYVKQKN